MPEYKRKKVNKTFRSAKKGTKKDNFDIPMKSKFGEERSKPQKENIKVVAGNKLHKQRRNRVILGAIAVTAVICILLSLILPGGLAENAINSLKSFGAGSYPFDISGSSVLDVAPQNSYYYVLTDTNISAYSNNGKRIFTSSHGFLNPVLKTSETRALVFDQGGKTANLYNLSGLIKNIETEFSIINANICSSNAFALATHSDNHASMVSVYDRNFNNTYTWYSAKDLVSHVLLNNKGNRLAVANINASAGQITSKLSILNFESADPLFTLDLEEQPVLSLSNSGNGFSVVTASEYNHINWKKYKVNSVSSDGEINVFRTNKKGSLVVYNRANDRSDNTILIISKSGKKISEFKINDFISDIRYDNGRIYYVNDSNVRVLSKKGELLRNGNCGYGCEYFSVIGANSLSVITNNEIKKIDIEKGE